MHVLPENQVGKSVAHVTIEVQNISFTGWLFKNFYGQVNAAHWALVNLLELRSASFRVQS